MQAYLPNSTSVSRNIGDLQDVDDSARGSGTPIQQDRHTLIWNVANNQWQSEPNGLQNVVGFSAVPLSITDDNVLAYENGLDSFTTKDVASLVMNPTATAAGCDALVRYDPSTKKICRDTVRTDVYNTVGTSDSQPVYQVSRATNIMTFKFKIGLGKTGNTCNLTSMSGGVITGSNIMSVFGFSSTDNSLTYPYPSPGNQARMWYFDNWNTRSLRFRTFLDSLPGNQAVFYVELETPAVVAMQCSFSVLYSDFDANSTSHQLWGGVNIVPTGF
jgi:hypothetical protein